MHVMSLEGRPQGPLEWETDRARFIGRGRTLENPIALDGRPLSGTTGYVLDPILSLRQRVRIAAGRVGAPVLRHRHRPRSRDRARPGADLSRSQHRRRARWRSPSPTRRARAATWTCRATKPCCSSGWPRAWSAPTARCAPPADVLAANEMGQNSLWPHGISGDLPILLVRVLDDDLGLVRQALEAQEYWRLKGLKVDLVVLNEHPVSYMDEVQSNLTSLLDDGPWRMWKHQPGGVFLLRTDTMGQAERMLFHAVARAVLETNRGDLRAHLARPPLAPVASLPLVSAFTSPDQPADGARARPAVVAEHERQRAGR